MTWTSSIGRPPREQRPEQPVGNRVLLSFGLSDHAGAPKGENGSPVQALKL